MSSAGEIIEGFVDGAAVLVGLAVGLLLTGLIVGLLDGKIVLGFIVGIAEGTLVGRNRYRTLLLPSSDPLEFMLGEEVGEIDGGNDVGLYVVVFDVGESDFEAFDGEAVGKKDNIILEGEQLG